MPAKTEKVPIPPPEVSMFIYWDEIPPWMVDYNLIESDDEDFEYDTDDINVLALQEY